MQSEMDALLDRSTPFTTGFPSVRHDLEKIRRVPSVDFGVQRVVHELVPLDPSSIHYCLADEGGEIGKDILDDSEASEGRLHGFHQARAHEAGVEGAHGGAFVVQAAWPNSAQGLQKAHKGPIMGQGGVHPASVLSAAVFLHEVVDQTLPQR
jgi:hypothetical protein